ncbi:hypothetical protein YB2330_003804 [Saitoella coloradoensis]
MSALPARKRSFCQVDNSGTPNELLFPNSRRCGQALEETSDEIDTVNALKGCVSESQPSPTAWDDTGTKYFADTVSKADKFRRYEEAKLRVRVFYKEQHSKQTVAYNLKARCTMNTKKRARMGVWAAIEKLNTLIDDSDPDIELSQIQHLLLTAEAIRRDNKPRWMQLTGLIHDLGKLLYFFDAEGQWDVVGDTFVVGCKFPPECIFPETFKTNPDYKHPIYSTQYGIYKPHCGLDNVMLSFGHDEYLYQICKQQSSLPEEALAMIRYHSFYPWHREGAYRHLMAPKDHELLKAVQAFNPYDLYSKDDTLPDVDKLKPYYMELIAEYFPPLVDF